MQLYSKLIPLGAVLALAGASAFAQAPAPAPMSSTPAAVGVSPQTATEANQKAIPRSDTGTLVRTSPSPADKARSALQDNTAGSGAATNGSANTMPMDSTPRPAPMRRARADRN